MSIKTEVLTGRDYGQLKTEIIFFVASAKSVGTELIKLEMKADSSEDAVMRRMQWASKILKSLKRGGGIQLFVSSKDFLDASTETEYLQNKYPCVAEVGENEECFIVKI